MGKLCKEVCQKCLLNYSLEWSGHKAYALDWYEWNRAREYRWNEDCMVWCVERRRRAMDRDWDTTWISIDEIPDYCPYDLEHIVLGEKQE